MKNLIDLIDFTLTEDRKAQERINKNPHAVQRAYCDIMRKNPNFHHFLMVVNAKAGPECARIMWYRLWAAIEDEREQGLEITLSALSHLPDLDDRNVELCPEKHEKKLRHCFEALAALAAS